MKLEEAFSGCKTKRGVLWGFDGINKEASQQNKPFDWTKHLSGEQVQGLSPVDLERGEVLFLGLDVDLKKKPEEFCKNIFSNIGTKYFCYRTMGGKWRVVEHLDDWIGVDEAQHIAKDLEKKVEAIGYKCDKGHTLPQGYNLEEGKPGAWWYMPYHNEETHCYSPGGLKLNKTQTEFRIKYKDHPIVVSTIGMLGKGDGGSRRKAIFCVLLYKKHFDCDVTIEELNENFAEPLEKTQLQKDITHCEQSVSKEQYNKEYYLKGEATWIKSLCGVKPHLDDKGFDVIVGTISETYVYVRSRIEFFEVEGRNAEFISKEQIRDWWLVQTKGKPMDKILLKDPSFKKVKTYLTHAGKSPGIIELAPGDVKGIEPGTYLNIYQPSNVIPKKGDVTKINNYYEWALGKENWHIIKQCLAFMLNEGGEKIQWFIILHSQVQGIGKGLLGLIMQSLFGSRNVRINVKFKQLISTHSTLVDGAQIICLNEVSFNDAKTGERKEFSEEFKNLITEPNLIVNPKHKKEVEVPNLCNFFVFSNSKKPIYLADEDRRAFVVNIKKAKEEVKNKLEKEGYKKELLKVIADPSAFKWHLLNEITYDREMFFNEAPMTEDKEEMIKANWSEFRGLIERSYEDKSFPFRNTTLNIGKEGIHYIYKGIIHTDTLYEYLKASQKFKLGQTIFYKFEDVEEFLKSKCTAWPNGETTKQIRKSDGSRIRVYCMEPQWTVKGKTIREMTDGELGKLWEIEPGKEDINRCVEELPNYEEPLIQEGGYDNVCWACKTKNFETGKAEPTPINNSDCEKCSKCSWGYICKQCNSCGCENPKLEKNDNY